MYFDRFDICEAYYWYAVQWNGNPYANKIHTRLRRIGFKPSSAVEYGKLGDNAQAIFEALEARRA